MRNKNRIITLVIIIVIAVIAIFTFKPGRNSNNKVVTVGVVSQTSQDQKIWDEVAKNAKDKYGVTIKIKNFTDYNQPNKALKNGDIDLNAFQHKAFLKAWNKANNGNLVSIGDTFLTPISIYSKTYRNAKSLPDGATIAIPNDASNESRALFLLKNSGLITLKKKAGSLATISDIENNPKNLKIKELSAEQTARSLDDVDASVVNTNYAIAAKLPDNEIINTEPVNKDSEQWINIIVARKEDKNKDIYKDVVKAYHTDSVKKVIKKEYGNTEIPVWDLKLK